MSAQPPFAQNVLHMARSDYLLGFLRSVNKSRYFPLVDDPRAGENRRGVGAPLAGLRGARDRLPSRHALVQILDQSLLDFAKLR